jgi:hypothetical protein
VFPFTSRPKGISKSIIIIAKPKLLWAIFLILVSGNWAIIQANGKESIESTICLPLIEKELPPIDKPVTCAAEKTIIAPKKINPNETARKVLKVLAGLLNIKYTSSLMQ